MYIWRPQNFWDFRHPLPPCLHFTQPISTVHPQNWAILEPPLPLGADVICTWSLTKLVEVIYGLYLKARASEQHCFLHTKTRFVAPAIEGIHFRRILRKCEAEENRWQWLIAMPPFSFQLVEIFPFILEVNWIINWTACCFRRCYETCLPLGSPF